MSSMDPPLSKNQIKKLLRDQKWEEERDKRKVRRKEKVKEKKLRKRAARAEAATGGPTLQDNVSATTAQEKKSKRFNESVQLPITIVLDCGFDQLMVDKERKSLASQITRCYSDNHKAPFKAHLAISSFEGNLQERFDSVLSGNYSSWKGVKFLKEDFVDAAKQARVWMEGDDGGNIYGALKRNPDEIPNVNGSDIGEVVYLTSDSPDVLTELRPYSTYIIGGIVDRNRHKGLCYKRAMDRGIKTAKLPISDYMQMSSRFVLATSHVSEIMIRWLELGDWGEAFLRVIPKRKGGTLKSKSEESHGVAKTTTMNSSCGRQEEKVEEFETDVRGTNESDLDEDISKSIEGSGPSKDEDISRMIEDCVFSEEPLDVSLGCDITKSQPEANHKISRPSSQISRQGEQEILNSSSSRTYVAGLPLCCSATETLLLR